MRVGYVRGSTVEQNETRQLKMVEEQKAEKGFAIRPAVRMLDGRISKP